MMANMKAKYEQKRRHLMGFEDKKGVYDDTNFYAQYTNADNAPGILLQSTFKVSSPQSRLFSAGDTLVAYEDESQCLPMTSFQAKQLQLLKPRKESIITQDDVKIAMKVERILAVQTKQKLLRNSTVKSHNLTTQAASNGISKSSIGIKTTHSKNNSNAQIFKIGGNKRQFGFVSNKDLQD
jgi:hypothetical protein